MKKFIRYFFFVVLAFIVIQDMNNLRWQCRISFIESDKVRDKIIELKERRSSWTEHYWYNGAWEDEEFLKSLSEEETIEFKAAVIYGMTESFDGRNGDASLSLIHLIVKEDAGMLARKLEQLESSRSHNCLFHCADTVKSWKNNFYFYEEYYKTPEGKKTLEMYQ